MLEGIVFERKAEWIGLKSKFKSKGLDQIQKDQRDIKQRRENGQFETGTGVKVMHALKEQDELKQKQKIKTAKETKIEPKIKLGNNRFSALQGEDEEEDDTDENEEDSESKVEEQVEINMEKSQAKINAILRYFNQSEDYMMDAVVKTMQEAIKSGNWMDLYQFMLQGHQKESSFDFMRSVIMKIYTEIPIKMVTTIINKFIAE